MREVNEHIIERYIRYPETLSEQERREVEQLLEDSAEAKAIHRFLTKYYAEFDELTQVNSGVIPLSIKPKANISGPVILAAKSSSNSPKALVTKATLISEEQKTLVRVLENQETELLQFHVLSEREQLNGYTILSLDNPQVDLVTDANGKLKDVKGLSNVKWEQVQALLRVPVFKKEIDIENLSKGFELQGVSGSNLTFSKDQDNLMIGIGQGFPGISRVLAVSGEEVNLYKVNDDVLKLTSLATSKIKFYFYE